MSIIGAPTLLAPILGPVVGGVIVQFASWRLIFLINVPIGVVAVIAGSRVFKNLGDRQRQPFDRLGFVLLAAASALIVYSLSFAGASATFAQPQTIGMLTLGCVLLVAFGLHARRLGSRALIDTAAFGRSRAFVAAAVMGVLFSAQLLGVMLLLSLYFQEARGERAFAAGALIAPQGAGAVMGMLASGRLTDRLGAGRVVPAAIAIAVCGTLVLTQAGHNPSLAVVAVALFVRGIGLGATLTPAQAAALTTVERTKIPQATTLLNIVQRLGGAIGTALLAVVLSSRLASHSLSGPSMAFEAPFWIAWGLLAVLIVPALALPRRQAHELGTSPEPEPIP